MGSSYVSQVLFLNKQSMNYDNCLARLGYLIGFCLMLALSLSRPNSRNFFRLNGIKHFRGASHHPATNEQAEKYAQIIKSMLRTMSEEEEFLGPEIVTISPDLEIDTAQCNWVYFIRIVFGSTAQNQVIIAANQCLNSSFR